MISCPYLRSATALRASSRIRLDHPDDVADRGIGVKAQQQVGRGQVEEMHGMGLDDLAHVQ